MASSRTTFGYHSSLILVSVVASMVLSLIVPAAADSARHTLQLADSSGKLWRNVSLHQSGGEWLVPLKPVADGYRWPRAFVVDQEMLWLPDRTVSLRAGVPFVQVQGTEQAAIQMLMSPVNLGGTLGLRLDDFARLFEDWVAVDTSTMQITLGRRTVSEAVTAGANADSIITGASQRVGVASDSKVVSELLDLGESDSSRTSMVVMGVMIRDTSPERSADAEPLNPAMDSVKPWTLRTVMIDPGHGGRDPGAVAGNLREKDIVLDIALRLAHLLSEAGFEAKLTRRGDEFVALKERTAAANRERVDLLVSIHCNSHEDTTIGGVEAYFLSPARTQRAVEVALLENAAVQWEDSAAYAELAEETYILTAMAASRNLKDSETWAAWALREISASARMTARGVDQAAFYVLMGATMPAILVECGYLSRPADARFLATPEGRQRIAAGLLKSITKTKSILEAAAR